MKKWMVGITVFALCMMGALVCSAQEYRSDDYGVSFTLSDDWTATKEEADIAFYEHRYAGNEWISFECFYYEGGYCMDLTEDAELQAICDDLYSNQELSSGLTESNGIYVSVTTDSVQSRRETYGDITYFRYEKAYTAHAVGYKDTSFYNTIFITVYNEVMYCFEYSRDGEENHFTDMDVLLNSVKLPIIGIEIDGDRIYPDSAPLLVEDRTLVPIRAVAERMGYEVAWDEENQLVTLTEGDGGTVLQFQIDSDVAVKNGSEEIPLDVPAVIIGSRTYLPLRAVAEAMEADVNWNQERNMVEIKQILTSL